MNQYNPNIHHRRSIRLKGYDYAQAGLYFITICTQNRKHIFGKIINGKMFLNDAGNITNNCWLEIPNHFPNVVLHEFVIMPNHVHGIIEIVGAISVGANNDSPGNPSMMDNNNIGANNDSPTTSMVDNPSTAYNNIGANNNTPLRSPSKTVGSVVRGFKIGVTKWFRQNTNIHDVWQRNYYENIIRNEQSYQNISNYIINNPLKWMEDRFHSNN